jgi:TRAP-type C4-dicarboxylate transport system permease small subunit
MEKVKKYLDYVIEAGAVIAFVGMCIAILIQVFARYLLNYPTPWAEELSRFLNVWAVFLAAAWGAKKGTHITIKAVIDRLPIRWQRSISLIINGVVSALLLAIFWGSITMMQSSYTMFAPAIQLRMTYFYLALCIGSLAMFCYYVGWIVSALKDFFHPKSEVNCSKVNVESQKSKV